MAVATGVPLQTEFEFALPKGYLDQNGALQRTGRMRLATAMDEIVPLRDPRVRNNQAYLTVAILTRVITKLGDLIEVNSNVVENLFTADLAYLQDFYRRINTNGSEQLTVTCPECSHAFPVEVNQPGEP
jgi:hypothetical protein